jgi:hypothetical protein
MDAAANRYFCTEAVMQENSKIASIVHLQDPGVRCACGPNDCNGEQ